ncbi:Gfo/Idh/MocA family protein [Streptomyces sp. SBT349]|uniref:Gfo/Idh/MocA family protein n=1 Tax=Streptomyces sp. SBT349 TaxID=1580539 RepID=UPI00066B1265|nr:Gfo/Idh/MocA family oxidoreductase [Streptomyces sp. SBT349]
MTGTPLPRVLLVGAGTMGTHHARVISESERSRLVAVVDPAEHAGRRLARRFDTDWIPKLDDLSRVDAVVVACSTDQHLTIASDVLAAGVPLLVEKPLSASLGDSREMVDTALRRGVPLMCGFIERFNPAVREILARVESPMRVRTQRLSSYSPRMRAGVSWDLLVHDLDLAIGLFGGDIPKVVHAAVERHSGEGRKGEDTVAAELRFPGDRHATLAASRVSDTRTRRLTVVERDRTIVGDLLNPCVTVYARGPEESLDGSTASPVEDGATDGATERVACGGRREPLAAQWDRFMDLAQGRADAVAEARSILPSHEAVAAILDSAGTDRAPHPSPPPAARA